MENQSLRVRLNITALRVKSRDNLAETLYFQAVTSDRHTIIKSPNSRKGPSPGQPIFSLAIYRSRKTEEKIGMSTTLFFSKKN